MPSLISRLFNSIKLGRSPTEEANMTCGLKIDTRVDGWQKTLEAVLSEIEGLSYSIDAETGMAYVSGKVDRHSVLKNIMKAVKHIKLSWVNLNAGNENVQNYGYNGGTESYQDPCPYHHGYHSQSYYPHQQFEPMTHYYPPNSYQYHYH